MKAVYIIIPIVIIAVILVISLSLISIGIQHKDNQCASWSQQITADKARLSNEILPSQQDQDAVNSEIHDFNNQCAGGNQP